MSNSVGLDRWDNATLRPAAGSVRLLGWMERTVGASFQMRTPMASDAARFLTGHLWAGILANAVHP